MLRHLIIAGGWFHLGFVVFHLMFWRVFRWKEELRRLGPINRAVMQVLNLCLTFVFLIFAYLSLFLPDEMLTTPVGRPLLGWIALFWLLRAFQQPIFFSRRQWASWALFALLLVGAALYGIPFASTDPWGFMR